MRLQKDIICSDNRLRIRTKKIKISIDPNLVTFLKSNTKISGNYQNKGIKPTTKNIHSTLKTQLAKNRDSVLSQDFETLNKDSATIGSKLSEALPESEYKCFTTIFEKKMVLTVTFENVYCKLMKLMKEFKNKRSTGDDGISYENLKICSTVSEKLIVKKTSIICLEERKVQHCLRIAKIVPVFKKGNRNNP